MNRRATATCAVNELSSRVRADRTSFAGHLVDDFDKAVKHVVAEFRATRLAQSFLVDLVSGGPVGTGS